MYEYELFFYKFVLINQSISQSLCNLKQFDLKDFLMSSVYFLVSKIDNYYCLKK